MMIILAILIVIGLTVYFGGAAERQKLADMTSEQRAAYRKEKAVRTEAVLRQHRARRDSAQYGPINSAMFCPHCQVKGQIRTKQVKLKKGVSGAKATGALLTAGVSLLATGLSRKEKNTQVHCGNCRNVWMI